MRGKRSSWEMKESVLSIVSWFFETGSVNDLVKPEGFRGYRRYGRWGKSRQEVRECPILSQGLLLRASLPIFFFSREIIQYEIYEGLSKGERDQLRFWVRRVHFWHLPLNRDPYRNNRTVFY